ncbi:hypothetical protein ACNOYE_32085 [Nannocystaceae bacterium ST9]
MSWEPLTCGTCRIPMRFERYGNTGIAGTVGVAWLCPRCGSRSLDVCPMHGEPPGPGMCLDCGRSLEGAEVCPDCGAERAGLVAAIDEACGSPPSLNAALELIDRGLIRLAANAIDLRIELVPDDSDAWLAKAEMLGERGEAMLRRACEREPDRLSLPIALHGLLVQRKDQAGALLALDVALPLSTGPHRGSLQTARAELLCALERADEALLAIDEALLVDSSIPRRHYLRGWALGMLGELEQARDAMLRVLELAPADPSATRALDLYVQAMAAAPH